MTSLHGNLLQLQLVLHLFVYSEEEEEEDDINDEFVNIYSISHDFIGSLLIGYFIHYGRGCRGRDHIVIGFTTTYAISVVMSLNFDYDVGYLIQHYVIKIVIDLRQVSGFLQVLRLPPSRKLTATI